MSDCANCGAHLQGPYCHQCGQKADHIEIGVRDFAHEALHEFLHLDGKIFQTLKLLVTKPGELTRAFFGGRRVRYISPVRLYLTCSFLYFALATVAPGQGAKWKVTATDVPTPEVREAVEKVGERMAELRREMPHEAPKVMFALMPTFALLTWSFYRKAEPYYVPHLYYSIHFHAFTFLVFALAEALSFGGQIMEGVGAVLSLVVVPYHYIGLRRVFGGSRTQVAWKGTAILVIYTLILALIMISIIALIVRSALAGTNLHSS